jgi:hypothetical protein
MMGDYHYYLVEFATGDKQKDSADKLHGSAWGVFFSDLHCHHVLQLPYKINLLQPLLSSATVATFRFGA